MPEETPIFSHEYEKGVSTEGVKQEPADQRPIEMQLEEEVKQAVKTYGTGKPRRETTRAYVIHD